MFSFAYHVFNLSLGVLCSGLRTFPRREHIIFVLVVRNDARLLPLAWIVVWRHANMQSPLLVLRIRCSVLKGRVGLSWRRRFRVLASGRSGGGPFGDAGESRTRRTAVPAARTACIARASYYTRACRGGAMEAVPWKRCHGSGATIRPRRWGYMYWHLFGKYGGLNINRATAGW